MRDSRPHHDEEFTSTTAITALLAAAKSKTEFTALTRVGARVGYLWTCPICLEANYLERERCRECSEPKPATAPAAPGEA